MNTMFLLLIILGTTGDMCKLSDNVTTWQCKEIVTCEWADWRYAKSEDHCIYRYTEIKSLHKPLSNEEGGEWCIEINYPYGKTPQTNTLTEHN